MGVYLSTYVGPVVLAKKFSRQMNQTKVGCSNTVCQRYQKHQEGKFCNECASPIKPFPGKMIVKEYPTYADVVSDWERIGLPEDDLFLNNFCPRPPGYDFWHLSNSREINHPEHFVIYDNEFSIEAELANFKEKFAKHLEAMRSLYEEIEIRWAFANWES